ncbi:MAG: uracil-DNA glycosylase family protein [Dyadobacter sp.]
MHINDPEKLKYQPEKVKILFIGEAPSAGAKRFYLGNTNLFRTIKTAFSECYGDLNSIEEFFYLFKSLGCYLDHLSSGPVNKEDKAGRKLARAAGVSSLSERLKYYQPEIVIILMKELQKQVNMAVELSGIQSIKKIEAVPYPAGSDTNRKNCIIAIVNILKYTDNLFEE